METTFFRSFPKKFEFVSLCSFISLARARPYKNNGLVKLVYQSCVADVSNFFKYFIGVTCGKIKNVARII